MMIQGFSNDLRQNLEHIEHPDPYMSSVDSELEMIWNYTYGEYKQETVKSLVRLPNGNYILSGFLNVSDNYDIMVMCFAPDGTSLWNQSLGYSEDDYSFEIIACNSGGVAIVGRIKNTTAVIPSNDAIIIRIASNGVQLWNRTYGGPEETPSEAEDDRGYSIVECTNGDFAVAGLTGIDGEGSNIWLFRVDPTGNMLWNRTYHNWDTDRCFEPHCLVQTNDNGFAIAGYTYNASQSNDVWLIRTNPAGYEIWNHTYGAIDEYQRPEGLVECASGGFAILAANKTSGAMHTDAWIIRTDPGGNEIWNSTYGGEESDGGSQIMEMPDGGFVFVGATHSFDIGQGDIWLVRTYANGSILWNHTIATPYGENGASFVFEGSGIYTIAGSHHPVGEPGSVIWLMKVRVSIIPPENGNGDQIDNMLWLTLIILSIIGIAAAIMIWQLSKRKKKRDSN
jgi:hypothetical protein